MKTRDNTHLVSAWARDERLVGPVELLAAERAAELAGKRYEILEKLGSPVFAAPKMSMAPEGESPGEA